MPQLRAPPPRADRSPSLEPGSVVGVLVGEGDRALVLELAHVVGEIERADLLDRAGRARVDAGAAGDDAEVDESVLEMRHVEVGEVEERRLSARQVAVLGRERRMRLAVAGHVVARERVDENEPVPLDLALRDEARADTARRLATGVFGTEGERDAGGVRVVDVLHLPANLLRLASGIAAPGEDHAHGRERKDEAGHDGEPATAVLEHEAPFVGDPVVHTRPRRPREVRDSSRSAVGMAPRWTASSRTLPPGTPRAPG